MNADGSEAVGQTTSVVDLLDSNGVATVNQLTKVESNENNVDGTCSVKVRAVVVYLFARLVCVLRIILALIDGRQ